MNFARAAVSAVTGALTVVALAAHAPSPECRDSAGRVMDGLALGRAIAGAVVEDDPRHVGERRPWPGMVITDCFRQHRVRHVRDQRPAVQGADAGIYGNDFIAEMRAQGLSNAEINTRLRARDNEIPEESDEIRYMVYAFDALTGVLKWEREAYKGLPTGGRHRKNTYASETPFTDGERLYALLRREHRPVRLFVER
jgi:hypothetical protein